MAIPNKHTDTFHFEFKDPVNRDKELKILI
jgi:hypothetical protein